MAGGSCFLKEGTIRLFRDNILLVRRKFSSVREIAQEYHLSESAVYLDFRKFADESGIPYSTLLYFPHSKHVKFAVGRRTKHRYVRSRMRQKRVFYIAYDYQNFNLSMVEEYLNSSEADDWLEGAKLLEETISKILEATHL